MMRSHRHLVRNEHGVTLIALIAVLIVLGILAAIAMPRFGDLSIFKTRGFYDQLTSALRYAQKAAVASGWAGYGQNFLHVVFGLDLSVWAEGAYGRRRRRGVKPGSGVVVVAPVDLPAVIQQARDRLGLDSHVDQAVLPAVHA